MELKKSFHILVLILILSPFADAQIKGLGWAAKFGAAGGYTPVIIYPDFSPLNGRISTLGFPEISGKSIYAPGGSGYFYIMSIKNLRIGGMGFGGSTEDSKTVGNINYASNYDISGGGLTLEYTLPFIKKVGVSFGVILGVGNLEINLYKNNGGVDWNNLSGENSTHLKMYSNYYILIPTVNIDIPVNRFLAFRAGAGYQSSFDYDWKIHNNQNLANVPDGMNGDAFFIQVGILAGFFAF
ncbi:MAG: hypothetical protein ACEPO8_10965 [Rhodothermaceae bacterium]